MGGGGKERTPAPEGEQKTGAVNDRQNRFPAPAVADIGPRGAGTLPRLFFVPIVAHQAGVVKGFSLRRSPFAAS